MEPSGYKLAPGQTFIREKVSDGVYRVKPPMGSKYDYFGGSRLHPQDQITTVKPQDVIPPAPNPDTPVVDVP